MSHSDGARVEIVETNHDPGTPLIPTRVRVNGVDVGLLARAPKVAMADDDATTVTLVLLPSSVEIKGDDLKPSTKTIGFSAG